MATDKIIFICILAANALIACLYYLCGYVLQVRKSEQGGTDETRLNKSEYAFKTIVMLLCPVVGVLFFVLSKLLYLCLFRSAVDLEDVIFGKDKMNAERMAEEDRERNRVPLEEALAVSDKGSLRSLMLDIIRGNVDNSLATISLALNSEDTETAHYAAAVLRDTLNDFRQKAQEMYNNMKKDGPHAADYACELIEYMHSILSQNVFSDMEQSSFAEMMEDACEYLYESLHDYKRLTCEYLEWLITCLLQIKKYAHVKQWCDIIEEMYPDELAAYTVQLKYYFSIQDREKFFAVMDKLKKSDIVIDRDTLDLIRVFS